MLTSDEFHQKIEEAKKSSAAQLDAHEASKVTQFLDCIGQTDKGLVACNEEVLGGLTEEERDNFYGKLSEIAPAAVDDEDEE
ncbi:unnamed protein product [Auanema sp. JU1783]|nr:unnamed protein product [Auanema sp. JU1783]